MATPKFGKYVWCTWISGLLAGDDQCAFAAWFKTGFTYKKVEDPDFDSAGYKTIHKEFVNKRANELAREGWDVSKEGANSFKVKGKYATVGGKPDIVAQKDGRVLVVDVKTGARRAKDYWQVLIYMAMLPRADKERYAGLDISGEVYYSNGEPVAISSSDATPMNIDRIFTQVRECGFDMPPEKSPSEQECQFCSIPKEECPERLATTMAIGTTDEF